MDTAFQFGFAADHRVNGALAGKLGEIPAKGVQRGRLGLVVALRLPLLLGFRFGHGRMLAGLVVGIELLHHLNPGRVEINLEIPEHLRRHAFPFAQQTQQDVFGPHVGVVQGTGLGGSQLKHLLGAGCKRDIARRLCLRPLSHGLFNLKAEGLHRNPHAFEHGHGHPLPQRDQP